MALAALVAAQGASIDVVHAQARHHIGVEADDEVVLAVAAVSAPGFAHDDIGNDDVALHVGKATAGAGLQASDQRHGGASALFAVATQLRQAADVAAGQHLQRLLANAQRGLHRVGVSIAVLVGSQRRELQRQAFGQVARTHAGGLQALQQALGHGEAVHQLFDLLQVVRPGQADGQVFQRLFEVAVVVERFNEKTQRCAVNL
ncbi:hypothetical protein D3C71_1205260 [compost metagenome]